jgi:hypothetical protein
MLSFEDTRDADIDAKLQKLGQSFDDDIRKYWAKKHIDYCYSEEFTDRFNEIKLREQHPALNDLYNQYQMMLALLREGQK